MRGRPPHRRAWRRRHNRRAWRRRPCPVETRSAPWRPASHPAAPPSPEGRISARRRCCLRLGQRGRCGRQCPGECTRSRCGSVGSNDDPARCRASRRPRPLPRHPTGRRRGASRHADRQALAGWPGHPRARPGHPVRPGPTGSGQRPAGARRRVAFRGLPRRAATQNAGCGDGARRHPLAHGRQVGHGPACSLSDRQPACVGDAAEPFDPPRRPNAPRRRAPRCRRQPSRATGFIAESSVRRCACAGSPAITPRGHRAVASAGHTLCASAASSASGPARGAARTGLPRHAAPCAVRDPGRRRSGRSGAPSRSASMSARCLHVRLFLRCHVICSLQDVV